MSTYRIKDLLDQLHMLFQNGCESVSVNADEANLTLTGIGHDSAESDCITLASCQCGNGSDDESDDDNCYEVQFTYDEIATIASALANMPSIYEKAINDESYDPKEREAFQTMSDKMLRLKEKMEKAFQ